MTLDLIAFYGLALIAVASAAAMVLTKNAVYSALFLVVNFATVAVFYLILGAPFIAMAQVTIYAGAIMVLFLFVIMLLGVEKIAGKDKLTWQKPFAIVLMVFLAFDLYYVIGLRGISNLTLQTFPENFGDPRAMGLVLFNEYLVPFEITSVLLLSAMIGAIVLTITGKRIVRPREIGSKAPQEK